MESEGSDRSSGADMSVQSDDRSAQLKRRAAQFFQAQGISAFSANVLVELMQVRVCGNEVSCYVVSLHSLLFFFRIQKLSSEDEDQGARVRAWVLQGINSRKTFADTSDCEEVRQRVAYSPLQRGCPDLVPQLRNLAVWPSHLWTGELAWIQDLERMYPVIKEELLALRGRKPFQVRLCLCVCVCAWLLCLKP
jgi:hypothetical protein